MKDVLLLGNGINNLSKNRITWDELLNDIVNLCDNTISIKKKKLPILYEESFLKAAKLIGKSEKTLKEEIAKLIGSIEHNSIHEKLLQLNVFDIITTNYDHTLQNYLIKNGKYFTNENKSENEFNIFRFNEISGKRFWHIHGDISKPKSIVLGFDFYCRQTHKIEDYLKTKYDGKFLIPFIVRYNENLITNDSWIDLFFTANIHIVGLGLGFEETDLWWLLTQRARLKIDKKLKPDNKIFYYEPIGFTNQVKTDMFKAVEVEVRQFHSIDDAYYIEVIDHIKSQLSYKGYL